MAALVAAYGLLWAAGGNDIIASRLHLSLNGITYAIRGAVLVVPPLVFLGARRWCLGLQRADNDRLAHGEATGVILRSPTGGYTERHAPLRPDRALAIRQRAPHPVRPTPPPTDAEGNPAPHGRSERVRSRLSQLMYADDQPLPQDHEPTGTLPTRRGEGRPSGTPDSGSSAGVR
jgi:ubiquinol-cytochrome c reductase cytochrome b subunit